ILAAALLYSFLRNPVSSSERDYLLLFRESANAISVRIMNTPDSAQLYQFILESCLKLIPKAKCGNVLLFGSEGLLLSRASVGFGKGISDLKLRLEDSFVYLATGGRLTGPVIMNRLGDIMPARESDDESVEQSSAIKAEIAAPLFDNGTLVGLLCIDADKIDVFTERDVSALDYMSRQISIVINYQKLKSEAQHLSRYDNQTDLMNRSSFEQEIFKIFGDPSRDTANLYFVLMNLDGLRHANDTFGHHFGDKTIENFSEIIKGNLGKNDLCGRYGGDEFVAVIQGDFLHVNFVLENTRKEFQNSKSTFQDKEYAPDFSYGYNSFREGLGDLDTFYKLAEYRMREMKSKKGTTNERDKDDTSDRRDRRR
ncbi:MAG TPA: sensor domain-containing diguanylate cyclase, partial [Anaerovoracaceae bacterium]|nr:sensor domain-containing diguanylate cyclase [Anaerovoracaceae bacterium]